MSEPVHEPAAGDQLHEQQCFACWVIALGVDLRFAEAMLGAAFRVGWAEALTTLGAPAGLLQPATLSPVRSVTIERLVRQAMATPPSADVAAAMNGHRHG